MNSEDVEGCTGHALCRCGQKGLLLCGAKFFHVNGGFFINNNTVGTNPNDSGIVVKKNGTTLAEAENGLITGVVCRDDKGTQTQAYRILIEDSSTGITCRNNRVQGNKTAGINDSTGTPLNNVKAHNEGYKTEGSGSVVILNGTASIAVTTGIASTGVTLNNVQVTPVSDLGGRDFWVSNLSSIGFTITVSSNVASDTYFRWCASTYYGE